MGSTRDIAIVGAGITGLTVAHDLADEPDCEPTVFEASERAGGRVRSSRNGDYLLEAGPHTILQRNRATADLIDELGLRDEVVTPGDDARKRFVVRDGELRPAPMSLGAFFGTDLLSTPAKFRLLGEPFVRARRDDIDESLATFVRRRLGDEVLEYAVDPMVGGVFAGLPRLLSTRHSFESLWRYERDHGSLTGGLLAQAIESREDDEDDFERTLLSFEGGSRRLTDALVDTLGDTVRFDRPVTGLERRDGGWRLSVEGADDAGPFDEVLWTAPAYELATLEIDDERGSADLSVFDEVDYPPVTVVATGWERSRVDHPLDGFGCLVPSAEPYRILGSLFMSSLFSGRAPAGRVLLSTFVGGARSPELTELSRDELLQVVRNDLRELLGIDAEPEMVEFFEWDRAIPQYEVGYGRILRRLDALESQFPGLRFTGSFRNGIAVPDLLEAARDTADAIADSSRPRAR